MKQIHQSAAASSPSATSSWHRQTAQASEWWAQLSITAVMACEQACSVWIGGLLDGMPTQTRSGGLGGTVVRLPSAAAILHAVHTAQSHTLNQTHSARSGPLSAPKNTRKTK